MSVDTRVYLDTSVLAKWYLNETHSEQVKMYIQNLDVPLISSLSQTEMRCLLARRRRMKEISAKIESLVFATFLEDIHAGHLIFYPIEDKHFHEATHLITHCQRPLRTLDALHLAAAQSCDASCIATADHEFTKAAISLGFQIKKF